MLFGSKHRGCISLIQDMFECTNMKSYCMHVGFKYMLIKQNFVANL